MFAIIKTGGKQYVVHPGDKIKVEKLEVPESGEVVFDNVLLVSDATAGGKTFVGTPYVEGYKVKAKVLGQGKGKKVIVYKYKPKKRYHKKQGHRQAYTEVEILSIGKGGVAKSAAKKAVKKSIDTARGKPAVKRASTSAKRATIATKKKIPATGKKATVKKKSVK